MSRSEMNVIALTWAATGLGKTKTISRVRTAIVWRTPKKPLLNTLLFAVWTNLLTNPRFRKTVHVSCNRGLNTLLLRVKAAKRIGLRGADRPSLSRADREENYTDSYNQTGNTKSSGDSIKWCYGGINIAIPAGNIF